VSRVAARCPGCQSVFFVSAAQGKVANNLVRCGRCGHLFNVLENLSTSMSEPEVLDTPSEPGVEVEPESLAAVAAIDSVPVELDKTEDCTPESLDGLDAPRASGFSLSNLATSLPDDFNLKNSAATNTGFGRRLALGLLIVVFALVGLAGQFIYFRLPTLSQQLAYRPLLQSLCDVLPCQLEVYSKPELVRVEQLLVRAHPSLEESLVVELVLINMASLEQPYPPLILRFDDLSGQQVAARRLTAAEYLPRSLSADGLMPVDKAVSIKLAILDPGDRALSYSVSVGQ